MNPYKKEVKEEKKLKFQIIKKIKHNSVEDEWEDTRGCTRYVCQQCITRASRSPTPVSSLQQLFDVGRGSVWFHVHATHCRTRTLAGRDNSKINKRILKQMEKRKIAAENYRYKIKQFVSQYNPNAKI